MAETQDTDAFLGLSARLLLRLKRAQQESTHRKQPGYGESPSPLAPSLAEDSTWLAL